MEISRSTETSIRIKTREITIVVDPGNLPAGRQEFEGDVVLLTTPGADTAKYKDVLVFYGPGEYEVRSVSIKCEKLGNGLVYKIIEDFRKVLVGTTDSLANIKETEGYTAALIFAKDKIDDTSISGLSSELVIVYGNPENVALSPDTVKKVDKLNLKKIEEFKGFVVYLSK